MDSDEIRKGEEGKQDHPELEKLVEQKQQETEALKRLIHILGKIDPNSKDHPRKK